MREQESFMREALAEAKIAYDAGEVPIGCVIVHNGEIIGRGHNLREGAKSPLAHGEIIAIHEASEHFISWRLEACDLYVTVEPCPMCMGAILNSRIDRLFIGTDNPRFGAAGSVVDLSSYRAFNHNLEMYRGLLQEECRGLMEDFFKELRREK